jgi:hypothetical protein
MRTLPRNSERCQKIPDAGGPDACPFNPILDAAGTIHTRLAADGVSSISTGTRSEKFRTPAGEFKSQAKTIRRRSEDFNPPAAAMRPLPGNSGRRRS